MLSHVPTAYFAATAPCAECTCIAACALDEASNTGMTHACTVMTHACTTRHEAYRCHVAQTAHSGNRVTDLPSSDDKARCTVTTRQVISRAQDRRVREAKMEAGAEALENARERIWRDCPCHCPLQHALQEVFFQDHLDAQRVDLKTRRFLGSGLGFFWCDFPMLLPLAVAEDVPLPFQHACMSPRCRSSSSRTILTVGALT